jgi:putative phosphoribosyl transferase
MTRFTVDVAHSVMIPSDGLYLEGVLFIPKSATGLVLFVHGSGSSRLSVRNQYVARFLNEAKIATLLFDLLTVEEEKVDDRTGALRFDIPLLAVRLIDVTDWCIKQLVMSDFSIGYFGASTGAAAALVAAAKRATAIKAVVSRGGRPDLSGEDLAFVEAPTLFIVGSRDASVIDINQMAMSKMSSVKKMEIVAGATHLFEEPGTLEEVASLAEAWFNRYLK